MNQNFVRCKICGQKFKQIINAHLKKHKISLDKYKNIYGKNSTLCVSRLKQISTLKGKKRPDHSKKMSGKNNPMFGKKRTDKEKILISKNRKGKGVGIAGKYKRTVIIKNKIRTGLIKYYDSLPKKDLSLFKKYWNEVWRETRKWINMLYENWNGRCYYTNQKLITDINKSKTKLYHSIDHKNSIIYGFKNNINPVKIGGIKNLCICSRSINSIKKGKTEKEFKLYLKRRE